VAIQFLVDDEHTALAKTFNFPSGDVIEGCPFVVGDLVSASGGIAWRVTRRWYRFADIEAGKPAVWYVSLEPVGDPLRDQCSQAV
jgi:hypothetical protein